MTDSAFARILLASALLLVAVFSANIIRGDYDTFYHLAAGRWFAENGLFPHGDPFSFTVPGGLWIIHEWLAQLVFFFIYSAGGMWALVFFCALLSALTYYFVHRLAVLLGANPALAAILLFPLAALTLEMWVPRPQIFSYFFFVLFIYLLELYRRDGARKWAWLSLLVLLFWSNMHSSMILGPAILFGYAALDLLQRRRPHFFGAPRNAQFLPFALLSLVVIFLNPDTYKSVFYFAYIRETVETLNVTEWLPIQSYLHIPQAQAFLAMMITVGGFLLIRQRKGEDPAQLGILLGTIVLPSLSIRHVAFFPLAAIPLLSAELTRSLPALKLRRRLPYFAVFAVLLTLGISGLRLAGLPNDPVVKTVIATEAIDFIAESGISGPGLNYSHDANYFLWRLWPEQKTFLDSRSEPYAGEPALDYRTIVGLGDGWRELVEEKYRLNYFLLAHEPVVAPTTGPLTLALLNDLGFRLAYWDDAALVLVRDSPENRALIERYGIELVNPFLDPQTIPEELRAAAEKEMLELDARTPSYSLRNYYLRFQNP